MTIYQEFPLLDMLSHDLNGDGYPDMIAAGCIYETEVETPRLDNGHGLVLLSNGVNSYALGHPETYRIFIPGNVKSLNKMNIKGFQYLIATKNGDMLSVFKINESDQI